MVTDVDVAERVERLATLLDTIAALTTEANGIKADLRANVGAVRDLPVAGYRLTIMPTRQFDAKRAESVLPPDLLARCMRTVVDRETAQRVLSPDMYAACQQEGALAVRLTA